MLKIHSFIPLLKFWLTPIFGLFAAGASALGDGGGNGLAAVFGSEGEGGGEGEGAGSGEGAGAGEGDGEGSGEGEGAAAAAQEGEGAQGGDKGADGRKMPAPLRTHLAELKAGGKAELAKEIQDLYWGSRMLKKQIAEHFPEGIKQAIELKSQVEEIGGIEAFNELQTEAEEWRSVDEQLQNGDPNVVKTMFEQFPEGLSQVMPSALEHWAEADADGYDRHMAAVAYSTVQQSGITNDLALAYSLLEQYDLEKNPALKRVAALLAKGYNWIGNLGKFASEKPAANDRNKGGNRNDQQLTEREQRAAAKERNLIINTISTNFKGFTTPKFDTELKTLFKDGKVPANVNRQEVYHRALMNVFRVLGAGGNAAKGVKSAFEKRYDAYLDAGDQDGALKFLKSKAEPLLHDALEKAYRYLYGQPTLGSGKGKDGGKGGNDKGGKGGNAGAAKEGDGSNNDGGKFELISYDPKPSSIDYSKTNRAMIFRNQAILKNGKKVTWKNGAPPEK